jgi:hypothetical protein
MDKIIAFDNGQKEFARLFPGGDAAVSLNLSRSPFVPDEDGRPTRMQFCTPADIACRLLHLLERISRHLANPEWRFRHMMSILKERTNFGLIVDEVVRIDLDGGLDDRGVGVTVAETSESRAYDWNRIGRMDNFRIPWRDLVSNAAEILTSLGNVDFSRSARLKAGDVKGYDEWYVQFASRGFLVREIEDALVKRGVRPPLRVV